MDRNKRATVIAGSLALAGMVAGAGSVVPVLEQEGFLDLIPRHRGQVLLGAGAQLLMVPAYAGFALALHPILRRQDEVLGLGFVAFRMIAVMFHLVGVVLLPVFLVVGDAYADAPAADQPLIAALGEVLRVGRDVVNHGALIIALTIGDLLLFRILYRARLVPRWLSVWGSVGACLALAASLLVLSGLTGVVTPAYLSMNGPLAVQTLVLGIWLIVRGFGMTSLDDAGAGPGVVTAAAGRVL